MDGSAFINDIINEETVAVTFEDEEAEGEEEGARRGRGR
jgi:hypothetical protein